MKRRLKITGVIVFAALLIIAAFPSGFFRHNLINSFDEVMEIFGIAFILLGQTLRVSARGHKSEHSVSGNTLVQSGPYAMVRNPMYLGILLIGLGIVSVLFRWWVVIIFLLVFTLRYLILIFREEKKLMAAFPEAYSGYRKITPRIIPSPGWLLRKDINEYLPLKLAWFKKEIGSILAVLFITLTIESWEDIYEDGLWMYLKEAIAMAVTILLFICLIVYLSKRTDSRDVSVKDQIALQ